MARRPEVPIPAFDSQEKHFKGQHFINETIDADPRRHQPYSHFVFEFCTFEKIGAKGTQFIHCEFRHCDFIDCYLAHAKFENCTFTGSYFERCVFSWADFPNSALDYTSFMNCGPVLSQVINQKPKDPQSAAKFLRNLAFEHRKLGNWEQVDRFIIEAYHERERHFRYVIVGQNKHYREHYSAGQRLIYASRYLTYRLSGALIGYGVSWLVFLRTIAIAGFVISPLLNAFFGRWTGPDFQWNSATTQQGTQYVLSLYVATVKAFLPFVPSSGTADLFAIPFWLSSIEAVFGTAMFAVFAALLFRWASKGN